MNIKQQKPNENSLESADSDEEINISENPHSPKVNIFPEMISQKKISIIIIMKLLLDKNPLNHH